MFRIFSSKFYFSSSKSQILSSLYSLERNSEQFNALSRSLIPYMKEFSIGELLRFTSLFRNQNPNIKEYNESIKSVMKKYMSHNVLDLDVGAKLLMSFERTYVKEDQLLEFANYILKFPYKINSENIGSIYQAFAIYKYQNLFLYENFWSLLRKTANFLLDHNTLYQNSSMAHGMAQAKEIDDIFWKRLEVKLFKNWELLEITELLTFCTAFSVNSKGSELLWKKYLETIQNNCNIIDISYMVYFINSFAIAKKGNDSFWNKMERFIHTNINNLGRFDFVHIFKIFAENSLGSKIFWENLENCLNENLKELKVDELVIILMALTIAKEMRIKLETWNKIVKNLCYNSHLISDQSKMQLYHNLTNNNLMTPELKNIFKGFKPEEFKTLTTEAIERDYKF